MSTTQHPGKVWMEVWVTYTKWHLAKSSLCSAPSGTVFSNLPPRHLTDTCHVFYIVRCDWLWVPLGSLRCDALTVPFCSDYVLRQRSRTLLSSSRADPYSISSLTRSPPKKLNVISLHGRIYNCATNCGVDKQKKKIKTAVNIYEAETLIQTQINAPNLRFFFFNAKISIQA